MITEGLIIKAGLALITGGLSWDIYQHHNLAKKIGVATKDLKNVSAQDIQKNLIDEAVRSAATESVKAYMDRMRAEIMADARGKLTDEARKAVKDASESIQKEVGERITTEASLIDISSMKRKIHDDAVEKVFAKVNDDVADLRDKADKQLKDLVDNLNANVTSVRQLYNGIANALSKGANEDKGLKLTIG